MSNTHYPSQYFPYVQSIKTGNVHRICIGKWQVGGAYTGQDRPLLWTEKGISQFKLNARVNSEVSSDFLEEHPKILVGDFNQFLFTTLLGMSPVDKFIVWLG